MTTTQMDQPRNNEAPATHKEEHPSKFKYFEYLKTRSKPKDAIDPLQSSNDEQKKEELVIPHAPDKSMTRTIIGWFIKPKRNESTDEVDGFVWVDDSEPSSTEETKSHDKPEKRNIFTKLFEKTFNAEETEDVDVEGFLWIEDPTEKKKRSLKYKLRQYFVQSPDLDGTIYQDGDDRMVEDFVLIVPEISGATGNAKEHDLQDRAVDFVAGSIAGVLQVFVSQPFDTVKVKLQTFPKLYRNMLQCFVHTYSKDGFLRGLYAGTLPAVVVSVAENSVLFACYGGCQAAISRAMDIEDAHDLSVLGNACAGSLAACLSTLTLCPTELVKCKLQAIQEMKPYVAKESKVAAITPFQLTKQIYKNEGIAGFYRGLSSTFAREIPGFFCFFGSYEATREYMTRPGETKEDIGPWKTMLAGSVGGVTLWTSTFPADVIKSRIQIQNLKTSMATVALNIVRKEGLLALYNGLLPSILRTIPATATLFLVYEYTRKVINDHLV